MAFRSIFPPGIYEKNRARLNIDHITKVCPNLWLLKALPAQPGPPYISLTVMIQKIIPFYFKLQQSQTEADQAKARESFYSGLRTLAERVKEPYFAGDQWTVVDMSIAPFVRRFQNFAHLRGLKEEDIGEKWMRYRTNLMSSFLTSIISCIFVIESWWSRIL